MVQRLLAGDALRGVEVQQLRKQVDGERVRAGEQCREGYTWPDRERPYVILRTRGAHATERVFGRCSKVVEDLV